MLPVSQLGRNHLIYFLPYKMKYNIYARIAWNRRAIPEYMMLKHKKNHTHIFFKDAYIHAKDAISFYILNRKYKADELKCKQRKLSYLFFKLVLLFSCARNISGFNQYIKTIVMLKNPNFGKQLTWFLKEK